MKLLEMISKLQELDQQGRFIFTRADFKKIFHHNKPHALKESLGRLVKSNMLTRICRGIYMNNNARSVDSHVLEHIAKALRRGEYNYISLESMLSEYGLISQIPVDRLTIMTTGRSGSYSTPYGVLEFTHTKRTIDNILENTKQIEHRPLRIATKDAAIRDLKRIARNVHLLQEDES